MQTYRRDVKTAILQVCVLTQVQKLHYVTDDWTSHAQYGVDPLRR